MIAELFERGDAVMDDIMLDNINEGGQDDGSINNNGPDANASSFERSADDMEDLLRESKIPLFLGSPMNRLGSMLMLLNMCFAPWCQQCLCR